MPEARRLAGEDLAVALRDSRARTLALVGDLDDAQWAVPQQPGVNPIAWELGHLAWFAEFWVLRGPHRLDADGFVEAARPARIAGPDALYDSARLAHRDRWRHRWPDRRTVLATLERQLDACIAAIEAQGDDAALYWHRLVLFHEDMHGEAFLWLRAALGWVPLACADMPRAVDRREPIALRGGTVRVGRSADEPGFAFDNERDAHAVSLAPFEIDAAPVDNDAFAAFVEAGGYGEPRWWPGEAGSWLAERAAAAASQGAGRHDHPARWRRVGGRWEERWFDAWRRLEPHRPVLHVSAWEAEAWCRWAGRRLPSAAEWEHAAQSPGFDWGASVWEWTADPFEPYPGFVPGPYRDYSRPWFHSHRELRGGSFAAHARLHDRRYRNFFMPDRCDIFAGFRSARATT